MKLNRFVFAAAATICCLLINASSYGQFKDAVITDIPVGLTPVFANNTGNCIYETGGTTYIVNVSDDNNISNAVFSWKVGTNSGFIIIDPAAAVVDPDVCLVNNNAGVVFAIVAYYDQNSSQFQMRVFNWVAASQQFSGNVPVILSPGQFQSAINIDANDAGDFAIVWDQPGQLIQLAIGRTNGGGVPQLVFPGTAYNIEAGTMPDVCMYRNSMTGYKQVDVAYINTGSLVLVDFYRFADLLSGVISVQPQFRSAPADLIYRYPRIDCPAAGFGGAASFTVVVEDSDNLSSWYIKGFNSNDCCPGFTTTIYNDGSTSNSPYNLTDVPNTKPVVAYQNNVDGINVGWNFDNSFGLIGAPGASVARYPVVISSDKRAEIFPSSKYLVVPLSVTFGNQIGNLSISGRHSSEGLYTYLNSQLNDIYFKAVPHAINANALRSENSNNFQQWINSLDVESSGSKIIFNVYDLLAKEVFFFEGHPSELKLQWNRFMDSARQGIYTGRSYNLSGNSNFSGKIFIGN